MLVSGAIANKYWNGGAAWTRLSWALGLQRLGYTVFFIEHIDREQCVDQSGATTSFEDSVNLAYFQQVTEQAGLDGSAALIYDGGRRVHGMTWDVLLDVAASSSLLVNISGHLMLEPILTAARRTAFVDLDP